MFPFFWHILITTRVRSRESKVTADQVAVIKCVNGIAHIHLMSVLMHYHWHRFVLYH